MPPVELPPSGVSASASRWPGHLILEVTNACDLACRGCSFHSPAVVQLRPIDSMPESLWRPILEEAASWRTPLTVQPWGMGEPLLHPQFWEIVAEAKRHPQFKVGFYSNGMQWKPSDIERACELGVDWICISVDGLRPEVFAHYRIGGDVKKALATVHGLSERRRATQSALRLQVNMVKYPELADHEEEFVEHFRGVVDEVLVSRFRRVGSRRFSPVEIPRVPCFQLETLMPIGSAGDVGMCCEDPQGEHTIGRFPDRSLSELWRSVELERLRRMHRERRWDELRPCRDCDGWTGTFERSGVERGIPTRERTPGTTYLLSQEAHDA